MVSRDTFSANLVAKRFNRNRDILPNPETMVPLEDDGSGDPAGDYINANYVRDAAEDRTAYICAQAPLPE